MSSPFRPEPARLIDVKSENADTKTYTLKYEKVEKFREGFEPGRFVMISIPGFGEAPFSLSGIVGESAFETTVRKVGNLTRRMDAMKAGEVLGVRGPYGRGWPMREAEYKDVLIVAGGIGIAPLKPVIECIERRRERYGRVEVLYGAKTPDNMIFTDEFDRWRRIMDFELKLTVDSVPDMMAWKHNVGVVPLLLKDVKVQPENTVVMTCGPEIMMHFVVQSLLARGFDQESIYVSLERRMKCGVAQCGHCMIGMKYVCRDGPVFPYSELKGLPDLVV
jgi:NAD(P)H-flavin reductase